MSRIKKPVDMQALMTATLRKMCMPPKFQGDGRVRVRPNPGTPLLNSTPMRLTRAQARRHIEAMEQCKPRPRSQHSPQGAMLWVGIEYALHNGWPYSITNSYEGDRVIGYELHIWRST